MNKTFSNIKNFDFNNLDQDEIGIWPLPIKIILATILFVAILFLGYQIDIKNLNNQIDHLQIQEVEKLMEVEAKAFKAANMPKYRQQMTEIQQTFNSLIKRLPSDIEVPGLLEDITHNAIESGLDLVSIELLEEVEQEYYVELPIGIEVTGGYHEIASFISGISNLPRIVTVHDVTIERNKAGSLKADIIAKTYRYNKNANKKNEEDNND